MIPLGDSILVLPDNAEEQTETGLILAPTVEMSTTGVVVATGPGKYIDDKLVEPQLKPGDKIMFAGINVDESLRKVTLNGVDYLLMLEAQIFGIIEMEDE